MSRAAEAKAALAKLEGADFTRLQQETGASEALLEDFKRFLALKAAHKDFYAALLSPSPRVDELWHALILDTLAYKETCERMLGDGGFIHHNPRGGNEAAERLTRLNRTAAFYKAAFGNPLTPWPVQPAMPAAPPAAPRAAPAVKREAAAPAAGTPAAQQPRRGASARVAHTASINFKFVWTQDGTETRVKCHPWVPLDDLMRSYCQEKGVNFSASGYELEGAHDNAVQFMFGGYRIESHDAPEGIGMEDGDVINVSPARVSTPGYVEIKVVAQDGNEFFFNCKRTKPLISLMRAWCQRQGVRPCAVRFTFNGPVIREHETPEDLEMEDGDVIDVSAKMQGC